MNCVKCGAELRSEQKVCIVCGTRTAAGGNFNVEEKEAWRPTRGMIYAAAGIALLLIIVMVSVSLRTVPPDAIAKEWFQAMVQRECKKAEKFHSPGFTSKMQPGMTDTQAISDSINSDVVGDQAQYTFSAPTYNNPSAPTTARVNVSLSFSDGHTKNVIIDFTKSGRRWLVSNVSY